MHPWREVSQSITKLDITTSGGSNDTISIIKRYFFDCPQASNKNPFLFAQSNPFWAYKRRNGVLQSSLILIIIILNENQPFIR